MQSYFPKALLFKEWRLGRWYLILGILCFSLGPLLAFVSTLSFSQEFISRSPLIVEQNIQNASFGLPGLGFLLIIFSAGLALVSLSEFFRSAGIQLASEPVRLRTILLTKFLMGIGIIVVSQMATSLWVWIALSSRHVSGPFLTLYGWWLICTIMELAFYSVTFVMVLVVRPIVISLLLMCAVLVAPLFVAEWFMSPWKHYLPDGSFQMNIPQWGIDTYNTIRDISPYGIIHFGMDTMVQAPFHFTLQVLASLPWTVLAFFIVLWIGKNRLSAAESFRRSRFNSSRRTDRTIIRAFSTLCAAFIVEHYVVHTHIQRMGVKVIAILFLWLCCHLLTRSFMGSWENGKQGKSNRRRFGVARGGTRG